MRNINLELKMENLKFQILDIFPGFFSQSIVFKTGGFKTLQFLYATKIKVVEVIPNFYTSWKYQKNKHS